MSIDIKQGRSTAPPAITRVEDSEGDPITNPGTTRYTELTLSGSGTANAVVSIWDDGQPVGTASVPGGTWSKTVTASVGQHSYTVRDSNGAESTAWVVTVSGAVSGRLKVMGARYGHSNGFDGVGANATSALLHAFDVDTQQPIQAQWQYEGDTTWTQASSWRDTDGRRRLNVKTSTESVTVNPNNFIGTQGAMIALRDDGGLVGWGGSDYAAQVPPTMFDLEEMSSTHNSVAARRQNGELLVWGILDSTGTVPPRDFVSLCSTQTAFAGIKTTGQVVAWGDASNGGAVPAPISQLTDVKKLFGGFRGFVAQRQTGQLVGWGYWTGAQIPDDIAAMTDILEVTGNMSAFAARRSNRRLVGWGAAGSGGNVPDYISQLTDIVELSACSLYAFAALRASGHVVAWGSPDQGGTIPPAIANLSDIISVVGNYDSFAALRSNGQVVAWGLRADWGASVPEEIAALSDIVQVSSTGRAFAALRQNGVVVAWGDPISGGDIGRMGDLLTDVVAVYSNTVAFAALTSDGRVVTWGSREHGGDSSAVQALLTGHVSYLNTD